MLQIRVISPPDLTPAVLDRMRTEHATANLSVQHGSAIEPEGDVIVVEITRELSNEVVDTLLELDLDVRGSISLISIEAHTSGSDPFPQAAVTGHGADAMIWQEIEEHAHSDARWTVTYYTLMVVAALIAAVAIIVDSPVLVIGAMIVGPEYAPLTAFAVSMYRSHRRDLTRAGFTLLSGLLLAIIGSAILTLVLVWTGEISDSFHSSGNFFTSFVSEPNVYSFIVAFLAGVLVSVTTIPAAAAVGVDAAVGEWSDSAAALGQLAINLFSLVLASLATLWVHDRAWQRGSLTRSPPRSPSH